MNKFNNVPFLILIIWLILIWVVFRICMMNISMSFTDVRWRNIFDNFSLNIFPFLGITSRQIDASEKSVNLLIREEQQRQAEDARKTALERLAASAYQLENNLQPLLPEAAPHPVKPLKKAPVKKVQKQEDKPAVSEKEDKESYLLQCGSFKDMSNARILNDKIQNAGVAAFIREAKGSSALWYRVMAGPFSSREDYEATKNKLASSPYSLSCYGFKIRDRSVSVSN